MFLPFWCKFSIQITFRKLKHFLLYDLLYDTSHFIQGFLISCLLFSEQNLQRLIKLIVSISPIICIIFKTVDK